MLPVLITIDTEYSSGLYRSGVGRDCGENFARCIACDTPSGAVGITYQMDLFDRHGLKGVFFVDPMPSLVWGNQAVRRIVQPILERGHDVQLHLHSEWLELAEHNPLGTKTGRNLADFSLADQRILLDYAIGQLLEAGAPAPVAFRAGNYGANDDTLTALAELGVAIDTSFAPGLAQSDCAISLGREALLPLHHRGTLELPIGAIAARQGGRRHAQLTAMSLWELTAAVDHARRAGAPAFTLVSHSFEMMNRKRGIANRIVQTRFERLCHWLAEQADITTADFRDAAFLARIAAPDAHIKSELLPHNPMRTMLRMGEQAAANLLYG